MNFHFVAWLPLLGDEINDPLDFLISNQHPLSASEFRGAWRQIKHIALAEKFVRPHRIQNGAGIDFRRDLKSDAGRNIRFNHTSDDIDTRSLGCDDAMNSSR